MRSAQDGVNRAATRTLLLVALALSASAFPASGEEPKGQTPVSPQAAATHPDADLLEPRALQLLKAAWEWLGAQESLGAHAEIQYDEVTEDETRVRVSGRVDLLVRRPDRFKVFFDGDRGAKTFQYDGKSFVLSDLRSRTWAAVPVPGPNDVAVDTIVGKLGVVIPLSDFLVTSAAYEADELRGATVVGLSRVAGRRCYQVLGLLDDLDFQLWIEADGNPIIRKMVLTHRAAPGQPQFEAVFAEWYPAPKLSDYVFAFIPDESSRKVELAVSAGKEVTQ